MAQHVETQDNHQAQGKGAHPKGVKQNGKIQTM
jgi:hypothetical protein